MTETFVPLVPAPAGSRDTAFASLSVNGAAPASRPTTPAVTDAGSCSTPVVTLQRTGDVVSGIRVQCGCGQVVDLACVF